MSERLTSLGQQIRAIMPSDNINTWSKVMVLLGLMYDEAIRMRDEAYERGRKEESDAITGSETRTGIR